MKLNREIQARVAHHSEKTNEACRVQIALGNPGIAREFSEGIDVARQMYGQFPRPRQPDQCDVREWIPPSQRPQRWNRAQQIAKVKRTNDCNASHATRNVLVNTRVMSLPPGVGDVKASVARRASHRPPVPNLSGIDTWRGVT